MASAMRTWTAEKSTTVKGVPIRAWTDGLPPIEQTAVDQLERVARLPFVSPAIAVMPDVHAGIGATVGSVIPTKGAVIPAAVGVDIGCGITVLETNLTEADLPKDRRYLLERLGAAVPHGRTDNGGANDKGAWPEDAIPAEVQRSWEDLSEGFEATASKWPGVRNGRNPATQLGTLGTGNHFLEICLDERGQVYIMVHSGSRGVGNRIGSVAIKRAKDTMKDNFIQLEDPDLAYFTPGHDMGTYIEATFWAQKYALVNRSLMVNAAFKVLQEVAPKIQEVSQFSCHHNYLERASDNKVLYYVTRKGAINAEVGRKGVIPGSMGARSYLVEGLGNPKSFCSASHGAGRKMSRTEAKKTFSLEDHIKATEGVTCLKDESVLDETPAAYKDIDSVMAAQSDLVKVVGVLKQIVCLKG